MDQEIGKKVEVFSKKLNKLLSSIRNRDLDIEKQITNNYLAIGSSYLYLYELGSLRYKYKQNSIDSEIKNLEKFCNLCITSSMKNLSDIALTNLPKSFKKDIQEVKKLVPDGDGSYFIFPREDTIILTFSIPYKDKHIVLSSVYSKDENKKYLNILDIKPFPGKYDLGKEVTKNLTQMLSQSIKDQPKDMIQESIIQEPYILIFPKEDVNIHNLLKRIIHDIDPENFISYTVKNDAIYLEPKSDSEKLQDIANSLKLNNNDLLKLLTFTQGA